MTIQESTICSLVQSFPILLILAQNHNRCLKTPLIYKPPTPTPSPEYYEALDALFQSLFGHGYHGDPHGCSYGQGAYYGKKTFGHGHTPCYTYSYPSSHGYDGHGVGAGHYGTSYVYPSYHGYSAPNYGYKKISIYNLTGSHGYKSYAPTQVYNMNHKYKVVVKRNKTKIQRRKPQKLQSFLVDRENRRHPFNIPQSFIANLQTRVMPMRNRHRNNNMLPVLFAQPVMTPYDEYGRPNQPRYPVIYNERPYEQPPVFINPNTGQYAPSQEYDRNGNFPNRFRSENNDNNSNQESQAVRFPGGAEELSDMPVMSPAPALPELTPVPAEEPATLVPERLPELTPVPAQEPVTSFPARLPELTPVPAQEPVTSVPARLPELTPVPAQEPVTSVPARLPELTPVPTLNSGENFNFSSRGSFSEQCEVAGYQGTCIPVLNCEPYVKLLRESPSNPAVGQLLRKVHCGFEGSNPKVCCPPKQIPDQPPEVPTIESKSDQRSASDFIPSFPEPPVCGSSNATFSRVVGGVDAKLGDFPWMALLGYKKGQTTDWLCGGTLVSSKHVLTASHCVHNHEKQLYVVRLGELDLARTDEGATPVDVLIKKQIKHEEYSSQTFGNDIALLLLERDVEFTNLIRPICIPRSVELRAKTFENYTPLVAGWGSLEFRGPSAQILQVLQLPVVSNDFCRNAYKSYPKHSIDERIVCAGYKKGGKDACQGDSGGPLMQPIYNSETLLTYFYQIGVVSFGKKCAEPGFPGVYSRITAFVPWLEKHMLGQ